MESEEAAAYLKQFIGKTLRISTTDGRMFAGTMRCTDKNSNIILSVTHEYRQPSESAVRTAMAQFGTTSARVPMVSRFVGLVVVPGQHITKIEFEESALVKSTVVP